MQEDTKDRRAASGAGLRADLARVWQAMPNRWLLFLALVAWVALFQFLGNSTLGYVKTRSLFGWWWWVHTRALEREDGSHDFSKIFQADEEVHAYFIPLVVLVLLWHKRDQLMQITKNAWWPALTLFVGGILLHVLGFMVQQARVSLLGFFLGIYGLTGLFWGRSWLKLSLFPFILFGFCMPLGSGFEVVTFPLRLLATKITGVVCQTLLGINVVRNGTQLFDAGGSYQYEVAAACSGIRSLTAIVAFGVIYGYITFDTTWRRLVVAAAALPLAVVANVFRLTLIVLAAEAFGQKAGDYVHGSGLFSLAPYLPAIGGTLLLGYWLREGSRAPKRREPLVLNAADQKS
jgi:exosortase